MPSDKPNILLIMTDQQRADFLGSQGFGIDTMPFLDGLSSRGVWFDRAYTSMPICIPTRVSMLTGRFAKAHGMIGNWNPIEARYARDLPGVLREAGYELALFGKNHSHAGEDDFDVWRPYMHTKGLPRKGSEVEDVAFDRWLVDLAHWTSDAPTPFPLDAQYPVRITSEAVDWVREGRQRPFFAWVSFPEPHSPYQVPEPYFDFFPPDAVAPPAAGPEALADKNHQWRYQYETIKHYHPDCDHEWGRYRSNYCGMLRLIDDQLERLVGALVEQDLLANTLVIYVSDHGEFCGDYDLYRKGLALPQCAIRIPMGWYGGPVSPHSGPHPAHVSITDIFPTLCEAIGTEIPKGVQGRSLWPLLTGGDYSEREFSSAFAEHGIGGRLLTPDEVAVGHEAETVHIDGVARTNLDGTRVVTSGYRRTIVRNRWKLVYDTDLPLEIYDIEEDPHELRNLATEVDPNVKAELLEELAYWTTRLDDNLDVRRYGPSPGLHNWHR
ncbi:MAG: sulfatase-like hydrolase/transferase [Candidatus Latescibacteria bacterium]|nr:sulfatase-like hydrolase/transferase [Candidatus Latescibacterota bacterium]